MSDESMETRDTMRGRANESSLKIWLLLAANRLLVTAVIATFIFILYMFGALVNPEVASLFQQRNIILSLFTTMIGALILGVTLVVAINQLIISQENGPLGDQHGRMSNTMAVRGFVTELIDEPAPAEPSEFLGSLISATESRARVVRRAISTSSNPELRSEVDEYLDSLLGNAESAKADLDGAEFGTFEVVHAALNYNYSWKILQTEQLKSEYEDVLTTEQITALDDLRQSLAMFGPAREHIKTLYFQWQLINLSRLILYTAIPGIVMSVMMISFADTTTITGQTMSIKNIVWSVGIAFTVSLVPFLLLTVYILRIATVAKRTLAIGPLILRNR